MSNSFHIPTLLLTISKDTKSVFTFSTLNIFKIYLSSGKIVNASSLQVNLEKYSLKNKNKQKIKILNKSMNRWMFR